MGVAVDRLTGQNGYIFETVGQVGLGLPRNMFVHNY